MKNYQILNWKECRGFKFIKSNPLKSPAAFHLIYAWSIYIGVWEIRKFMNESQMKRALEIFHNTRVEKGRSERSE